MARVFLSHASPDKPTVRRIATALRTAGHDIWLDEDDILVGESIPTAVERGLRDTDFVVLCISNAAATHGWVEAERDATLMQQFHERRERILPVRLEDVAPPGLVAALAHVDLFPDEQAFARGIDRLTHAITAYEACDADIVRSAKPHNASTPRPLATTRPVPAYPNPEVEALSKRLEDARARREKLQASGLDAGDVDREILDLRRHLREGGQLRPGDALGNGRYLLVRIVGRGGFAAVWEAYDCTERQRVAIKVLHANLAGDRQRRERFFRGASAMMKLGHPAVVAVLEPQGEDGGYYYFVMEFVTGGNLREAVLAERVKRDRALSLILQVGDALALAHSRGMVHRDIKPANIMLDEHAGAKLTDFDLVSAHDTTGGTRTGALGTVVYAAPECLDRPQEATARADVYGLGMSALFCLAGRELSLDTFRNPARTIDTLDCSMHVRNALRRAVAWESEERFPDAAAMVTELRNALNVGEQIAVAADDRSHEPLISPRVTSPALFESGEASPALFRDEATGRRPAAEVKLAAWLVFGAGEIIIEPRWFPLDAPSIEIGRTAVGIAVPADTSMSRVHATIHTGRGGRLAIVDQHSSNGTAVNGQRVSDHVLKAGDVISCGESCLVIGEVPVGDSDTAIEGLRRGTSRALDAARGRQLPRRPSEGSAESRGWPVHSGSVGGCAPGRRYAPPRADHRPHATAHSPDARTSPRSE